MALEIAVEIGTSYTSIYLSGSGIVLHEPTIVAFFGDPSLKRVRAVGSAAIQMLGKTPDRTTLVTPVVEGIIADYSACGVLLNEFIKKILPESYIIRPKIKAILGVPMGLTLEERAKYEDVCTYAGISEVTMVENIILSAIGIDLPIETNRGGVIVNIGGGTTEMAVLSLGGVISGCGITIGGSMMDKALIDYIVGKYDLKVGQLTADKIKIEIGSLYENDIGRITVTGRNVKTKSIGSAEIDAVDVCKVLMPYYEHIANAVENIINMCSAEVTGEIHNTGISLVGGGSKILGIDKIFGDILKLKIHLIEESEIAKMPETKKRFINHSKFLAELSSSLDIDDQINEGRASRRIIDDPEQFIESRASKLFIREPSFAAIYGGGKLLNDPHLLQVILSQK